jgi:hypothetical protein
VRDDLVFFFNNNQQGGAEDLFGWAQITLFDTEARLTSKIFDFTNIGKTPVDPWLPGGVYDYTTKGPADSNFPNGGAGTWPVATDFVLSGGEVTLGTEVFGHNLGANNAAFAIFSPELNNLIGWKAMGYDVMQVDIRLYDLTNGYEKVFLLKGQDVTVMPEPGTLLLMGFGLLGLGFGLRKKMR